MKALLQVAGRLAEVKALRKKQGNEVFGHVAIVTCEGISVECRIPENVADVERFEKASGKIVEFDAQLKSGYQGRMDFIIEGGLKAVHESELDYWKGRIAAESKNGKVA